MTTTDPSSTAPKSAEPAAAKLDAPKKGRGVHLTERAAKEIERVISEHGFDRAQTFVRVGAKGGGCSGFSYVLDFDQQGPTEFDVAYEMFGIKVVIDKKSEFFMGGTILDFNDGLLNRGFAFQNPSAKGTCGCGTSFSA
jgi:iron-sulfur cluster assembly protein